MPRAPSRVNWSDHALTKAELLGLARADLEETVLSAHGRRARNPRSADWLVSFGQYVIAYNHPDGDDPEAARIVTVWRT
jgi:hypothetical protein